MRPLITVCLLFAVSIQVARAQKLLRPGEKVLFSFRTTGKKTVMIACDSGEHYLVYRYGTDAHVELQYPHVPDTASWHKFAYSGIIRGQGFDSSGALDLNFLTFYRGRYQYIVYDMAYDNADYSTGVKVRDTTTKKQTDIKGLHNTRGGDLSNFRHDERVIQSDEMYEE